VPPWLCPRPLTIFQDCLDFGHAMRAPPHDHHHDLHADPVQIGASTPARLLKLIDFARCHEQSA
jgi:hypothetical protein